MSMLEALLLLAAGVLFLLFLAAKRASAALRRGIADLTAQSEEAQTKLAEERTALSERLGIADAEIRRLSKWKDVADADAKAAELVATAERQAATIVDEAKKTIAIAESKAAQLKSWGEAELHNAKISSATLLSMAESQAAGIVGEAKQEAKKLRDDARAALDSATQQAGTIVQAAEAKAGEVAGSAYEAMNNAALYERTVKAMKNVIEGYGDKYMVPERSLLDDLAEEFGYTQAGEELRKARERTSLMVRNATAATCEYVEENRRTTAISFVVDAFNGKVDSILSRVRQDNAGKLEQEIRDAFALVNFNGKAFREARIREEYLASRLDELKWAAVAQQLKLEEREEQRRIKEQLREEEKARREYERAIREAAKDEDLLQRAMEKAQQKVEQATAEQKAKYEQQLQELTLKLREAEERKQRALSMAEQTKRGYVYVISNVGSFGEHVYKIGLTRRLEPLDRIRELGDSSVPFEFDVHALIYDENAPALESTLHKHFMLMQMNKVNHRKEFFRVDLKHVREELEKLELSMKWTMAAAAREYRETLAIEKEIADDPKKREAWLRRQFEFERVEERMLEPEEAAP